MQPVSLTAQWTAAIRALESEKGSAALFRDDLARELAQPDGFRLLERYHGAGVREFVVIRTHFFDEACREALAACDGICQVVVVAAGMDTRAYRLLWPAGTKIFEIDHQELLREKAARLEKIGARPASSRIEVPADLAADWRRDLIAAGFDPRRQTLWLVEGLLFFLTEDQARRVLTSCESLSAEGSRIALDMASESLLKSPFSQVFLTKLRKDGIPWKFGTDEPERLLAELNWVAQDIREPGTTDAGKRWWPYPTQSRDIPGVARSWLVTAKVARARAGNHG